MTVPRAANAAAAATLGLMLVLSGVAAAQVPPNERYLTFETDNFRVIFPQGWETFARRAADRAEWAYAGLAEHFIEPPSGRISLVISDNSDRPNASATPIPFNRVALIATPHIANRQLNFYRDWLDITLVHELAHIFHLDRAAGMWSGLRTIFGRVPVFFPAFYQPRWVVEGLPTYYESRLTGAGRAYGGYFETLLSGAAAGDAFKSVDAADGLAPVWPANQTPYAYGGRFFRALAEQHGDSAVANFAAHGAARLPYTLDWAAKPHFGSTLSGGWDRWRSQFEEQARLQGESREARVLTAGTPLSDLLWIIPSPRFSPDSRYIAFTSIGPRDDATTVVIEASSGAVVRRARRNSAGGNAWSLEGATIFNDQLELADRYRIYGDLYELDVASGSERRLTVGLRVGQADLAPDGSALLVVQIGEGTNRLATIEPATGTLRPLTEYEEGVNWERPRWSPDGRRIAVERWSRGQVLDIVILDAGGEMIQAITDDAAVDVAPCWSPDGRYVLWASDREGTFDIYAADVSGQRAARGAGGGGEPAVWRVTRTLGGGLDPDVAPDGRWLAFVTQYGEGFRIERIAFAPADWEPAGGVDRSAGEVTPAPDVSSAGVGGAVQPYSPFPALWPKSWLPLLAFSSDSEIGTFVGATTFGADDVGRHTYAVLGGWRTGVANIQGLAAYIYRGFGDPILQVTASQDWAAVGLSTSDGEVVRATERERELRVAASFQRPRSRTLLSVTPVLKVEQFRYSVADPQVQLPDPSITDLEAQLVLGFSTARSYPRSVSAEKGFGAALSLSHRRLADDLQRWRVSAEADLRGYSSFSVFGYANHVLAARLAVGASDGHRRGAEAFDLGGLPGQPLDFGIGVAIGGGEDYHLRGFDSGVQRGDRIVAASLEYRLPVLLVGRGYKLWPILLDRISASAFVDAGSAWRSTDEIRVLSSAGAELSTDWGISYAIRYRIRAGLARSLSAPAEASPAWKAYLSAGIAF